MPRIFRTQKEREILLIREFLGHLGYKILRAKWKEQERPDALLTLSKGKQGKRIVIAIEHTDYFNDTEPGKRSPLTPINDFWRVVQASLIRRVSHRKHLAGVEVSVNLRGKPPIPKKHKELAKQLAKELIAFMEAHPVRKLDELYFRRRDRRNFNGYPMLESMLSWLWLSRWTNDLVPASRSSLTCSNLRAGFIGLNLRYIEIAIAKKNKKAKKYSWGDAEEKWLLIAASGGIINNSAGPAIPDVDWANTNMLDLCRNSPFDKIVFWERYRCWHKWLKPSNQELG